MDTIGEIRRLTDGEFHRLGDDLMRRLDPRYRRLRTHGLNERGESIVGQPDSYVGETAATCTIAVCYTVQRKGWWTKVVDDVRKAVAASPLVKEIVVVIPHDADRDGPKDKSIDWVGDSRKAAGNASFRVIDGRDIIRHLNTELQDLRHEHLGIAYSRLSGPSILASCRHATQEVIDSIQASGRYDPGRYAPRDADGELHRQWQAAFQPGLEGGRRPCPVRLISLVSDSGMGKTSLVCEFSRSLGIVLPVLLVQAGDLTFGTEDNLVAHVIQTAQGVLDQVTRVIEEVALIKHLAGSVLMTVVLDGLDETHNPEAVRRAISFWLRSKLGRSSILIVTSRREFWRMCVDSSWKRWMPGTVQDDRSPVQIAERRRDERIDPLEGFRLPDRFSVEELETSWVRAGQPLNDLFDFPAEAREELRHPFTLRVFLDLRKEEVIPTRALTRTALLERWLNRRLDIEALPRERITRLQFQEALRQVATRLAAADSGYVPVDDLQGVPRFDPTHPPGPVVHRLMEANILESPPGRPDMIRFSVATVQDFYQAEADFEEVKVDPGAMAERYSRLSFTTAYPRLARLGYRLAEEAVRDEFARRLADKDARMAAVIVRAAVAKYAPDVRSRIVNELADQILSRHHVRAAMTITLLGDLNCRESIETLAAHLLPSGGDRAYLKQLGATVFARLGHVPAAGLVYEYQDFGVLHCNENYFYKNTLAVFRNAIPEFRMALAEYAILHFSDATGTMDHARAVTVLAYLGDSRLVEHLSSRLVQNGLLTNYENHALIALGTDVAGDLFARSVTAAGEILDKLPNDDAHQDDRSGVFEQVTFPIHDVRYLITKQFEPHLKRLIEGGDSVVSRLACDLAEHGLVSSLLYSVAVAAANRWALPHPFRNDLRNCITAEQWLGWWGHSTDIQVRREVLKILPLRPNAEIEEILIICLESPDFQGLAIRGLGEYGAVRSSAYLRGILAGGPTQEDRSDRAEAAHALGALRDEAAVPLLEMVATEQDNDWAVRQALSSLGLIGTQQAERALERLLQRDVSEEIRATIFESLLLCGTERSVTVVVEQASSRHDGFEWLCKRMRRMGWLWGSRRGEYYTHIHSADLANYLESQYIVGSEVTNRDLWRAFHQIDSPEIRKLLKKWAAGELGIQRSEVRDDLRRQVPIFCHEELRDRGDESAIDYTIDERADDRDDVLYVMVTADHLQPFPATAVAERLRLRISTDADRSILVRMLALLGRFGGKVDLDLAAHFQDHPDDLVSNVACEAMLRLSDPLLLPDHWHER